MCGRPIEVDASGVYVYGKVFEHSFSQTTTAAGRTESLRRAWQRCRAEFESLCCDKICCAWCALARRISMMHYCMPELAFTKSGSLSVSYATSRSTTWMVYMTMQQCFRPLMKICSDANGCPPKLRSYLIWFPKLDYSKTTIAVDYRWVKQSFYYSRYKGLQQEKLDGRVHRPWRDYFCIKCGVRRGVI